jgi:hypothetical protein
MHNKQFFFLTKHLLNVFLKKRDLHLVTKEAHNLSTLPWLQHASSHLHPNMINITHANHNISLLGYKPRENKKERKFQGTQLKKLTDSDDNAAGIF